MIGILIGAGIAGLIILFLGLLVLIDVYLHRISMNDRREVLINIIFTLIGIIGVIIVITIMMVMWR